MKDIADGYVFIDADGFRYAETFRPLRANTRGDFLHDAVICDVNEAARQTVPEELFEGGEIRLVRLEVVQ